MELLDYQIQQLHCLYDVDASDARVHTQTIPYNPVDSYLLHIYPTKEFGKLLNIFRYSVSNVKLVCQRIRDKMFPHLTDTIYNDMIQYIVSHPVDVLDQYNIEQLKMLDTFPFDDSDTALYGYENLVHFISLYVEHTEARL